jgi:hypothetical protein
MKKFLLTICTITCLSIFANGQTQKRDYSKLTAIEMKDLKLVAPDAVCDSIGWPIPPGTSFFIPLSDNEGFLAGNNVYGDKAKGNFFDMTGSTANYLTRIILGLGPANGANGGNLDKVINIRVLDGTTGNPGDVIGTYASTLGEMFLRSYNFTFVNFSTPLALPASKKIFLILDFSTLTWTKSADPAVNDSISLLSTGTSAAAQPAINLGWEQWGDNTWHSIPSAWTGLRSVMRIYPLVSETTDGCNTLPVTFGGFSAKIASSGIDLNWQTLTEMNNQRFEVERSTDALKFTAVGTVLSKAVNGNHQGQLNYQFTDANPTEGVNYYRIRQIDKDGASAFTKVVKIAYQATPENSIIRNYYPNPASDRLFIQLGAGIREVETVRFTDASGKILGTQKPAVSPDGVLNVSTRNLRSGLNFATVILPDGKQTTIKVLKD